MQPFCSFFPLCFLSTFTSSLFIAALGVHFPFMTCDVMLNRILNALATHVQVANKVLGFIRDAEAQSSSPQTSSPPSGVESANQSEVAQERAFGGEQVQEQEQEQENEVEQEQEVEEEQEAEEEPAEFARKKYARDDEPPAPWPLTALATCGTKAYEGAKPPSLRESEAAAAGTFGTPGASAATASASYDAAVAATELENALGFYPVSKFAVTTKVTAAPEPLQLPDDLLVSKNYFKLKWLKSMRRLKNVVVTMEWVPDLELLAPWPNPPGSSRPLLGDELEARVRLKYAVGLLLASASDALREQQQRPPPPPPPPPQGGGSMSTNSATAATAAALASFLEAVGVDPADQSHRFDELAALTAAAAATVNRLALAPSAPNPESGGTRGRRSSVSSAAEAESQAVADLCEIVSRWGLLGLQRPRYTVVRSLVEAESLRGVLHRRGSTTNVTDSSTPAPPPPPPPSSKAPSSFTPFLPLLEQAPGCSVALLAHGDLLDASLGHPRTRPAQQRTNNATLRFLDGDVDFGDADTLALLRALQANHPSARLKWFVDVRECRRRVRVRDVIKHTSLGAGALTLADESIVLEYRAIVERVVTLLRLRGMFVLDAFRAFDSDRDGWLTCSELYGGLDWLGIPDLTEDQVYGIFTVHFQQRILLCCWHHSCALFTAKYSVCYNIARIFTCHTCTFCILLLPHFFLSVCVLASSCSSSSLF